MVSNPYQRYEDTNIIYYSHFLVIVEATSKYAIVFVRLILGKVTDLTGHNGKLISDINLI